jgi:hypothetical protein
MMRWGIVGLSVAMAAMASSAAAQGVYDDLIAKHAAANNVPEQLVRRVIRIESRGNASAVSKGNYGLMQIRLGTARAMGYDGEPKGLLDADTNMKYAVRYLAGAYRAAGCDGDRAVAFYRRGYYGAKPAHCGDAVMLAEAKPSRPEAKPEHDFKLAQSQTRLVAQTEPGKSVDALKPKVVHTVVVQARGSSIAQAQGSSMDVMPAAQPHLAEPIAVPPPEATNADSFAVRAALKPVEEPVTTGARTSSEPEPISLPQVNTSDPKPAPKHERGNAHHPATGHALKKHAHAHAPPTTHAGKKGEAPTNLLSFLKKLIAPEQKPDPRPHKSRAGREARR